MERGYSNPDMSSKVIKAFADGRFGEICVGHRLVACSPALHPRTHQSSSEWTTAQQLARTDRGINMWRRRKEVIKRFEAGRCKSKSDFAIFWGNELKHLLIRKISELLAVLRWEEFELSVRRHNL